MKTLTRILFLCIACLSWQQMQAEVMLLNENMTLDEALKTPYTITKSVDTDAHTITIDFRLNAIEFVDFDPVPGTKVCRIPGMEPQSLPELPQIPVINVEYNIPCREECSIQIAQSEISNKNISIAPGMPAIAGYNFNGLSISPIKNYSGYYPSTAFSQTTVQFYRGIPIHYFAISPVSYDNENNNVRITNSFRAIIAYTDGIADSESDRSATFKASRALRLRQILEETESVPDADFKPYPAERTQDYLIIANIYTQGLEEFIEWKRTLGYRVHVVREIPGKPGEYRWTWRDLQNTIRQNYKNLDNLTYVLLWGHWDGFPGIPFSYFAINKQISRDPDKDGPKLSDVFSYTGYALMDSINDLIPEFSVGRIHGQNLAQNKDAIAKIINYERNPPTDRNFYKNAFLAGRFDPFGLETVNDLTTLTDNDLQTEDYGFIQWLERTKPILTKNGINVKRIYKLHELIDSAGLHPLHWSRHPNFNIKNPSKDLYKIGHEKDIPNELLYSNFEWKGKKEDVISSLREGSFLGIYYSHGNCNGWYAFDNMTATDFNNANCGRKSPLIFSISCRTGTSDFVNSFGNALSHSPNGPIGMFASADISYVIANQYLLYGLTNALFPYYSPSDKTGYFHNYPESFHMGDILMRGIDFCHKQLNESDQFMYKQHQLLTYTCFGDPSIDIHTDVPHKLSKPQIVNYGPHINVNIYEPHEYPLYVNFYEKQTGRVESYEYVGWDNYFTASGSADSVQVSITSHNMIPYIDNVRVNDGESFNPQAFGRFIQATRDEAGDVRIYFDRSTNIVDDMILRYSLITETLTPYKQEDVILEREQKSYNVVVPVKFKGYLQFHLIHQERLLDSYRVKIDPLYY